MLFTGKTPLTLPFRAIDRAHLELPDNIVGFVHLLDGPTDRRALEEAVARYVADCPKLRCEHATGRRDVWREVAGFRGPENVHYQQVAGALSDEDFQQVFERHADLACQPGPPWRMIVLSGTAPMSHALIILLHHSVGDGYRVLDLVMALGRKRAVNGTNAAAPLEPASGLVAMTAARMCGAAMFLASAADALFRAARLRKAGLPGRQRVVRVMLERDTLRRHARRWNVSTETVCYVMAAGIVEQLRAQAAAAGGAVTRLIVPAVYRRHAPRSEFANYLLPLELSLRGRSGARAALRFERARNRFKKALGPFLLAIFEQYIWTGVFLAKYQPRALTELLRQGWGRRFSASCTVIAAPPAEMCLGGAQTRELYCLTPQLSSATPSITFTMYKSQVALAVRFFARDEAHFALAEEAVAKALRLEE